MISPLSRRISLAGKKSVEGLAAQTSGLDLNSADERANVSHIFENAVATLSDDDRKLPQAPRSFIPHHPYLIIRT